MWSGGLAKGCNPTDTQDLTSTTQTGAVRCCSYDGGSYESELGLNLECLTVTFSEAQQACSEFGMRLCTEEELWSNICCTTGCGFDADMTWYRKGKLFCSTKFNSTSEVHFSFFGTPFVRILEYFIKYHSSNKPFRTEICFEKILLIQYQ